MNAVAGKRCFNHPVREAAARCPECGRFYCRECVTEHDNRVLCAACLNKKLEPEKKTRQWSAIFTSPVQLIIGVWFSWLFFYYVGKILLKIPSSFHEGTIW